MANLVEVRVGRLVEITVDSPYRTEIEVSGIFAAVAKAVAGVAQNKIVLVADWRQCPIMSEEASRAFADSMRRNNERVLRSAALARADAPSAMLQFVRLIREADNPQRRLFQDKVELVRWLDEVLDTAEQARLREFVAA